MGLPIIWQDGVKYPMRKRIWLLHFEPRLIMLAPSEPRVLRSHS